MKKQTMKQLRLGMAVLALCGMSAVGGGQTFAVDTVESLAARVTALEKAAGVGDSKESKVSLNADTNNGENGIAIGMDSFIYADGSNAVAIGYSAKTNSPSSIVIGDSASATISTSDDNKSGAIAIGQSATSLYGGAISLGTRAKGEGHDVVSIGTNSHAYSHDTMAIGSSSSAQGAYSLALGSTSVASGNAGIANGYFSKALGDQSIAIGLRAKAGKTTTEKDDDTTLAEGASASNAIAIGNQAKAYDDYTIALGNSATASADDGIAIGRASAASGAQSIALGYSTEASKAQGIALGYKTKATAANGTAIGQSSTASGAQSIALGYSTEASGAQGIALGYKTKATAANGTAIGQSSTASGAQSIALGYSTEASGAQGIALGNSSKSVSASSVAIGDGAKTGMLKGTDYDAIDLSNGTGKHDANHHYYYKKLTVAPSGWVDADGNEQTIEGTVYVLQDGTYYSQVTNNAIDDRYAVAIGQGATAKDYSGIALGRKARSNGEYAIAIGGGYDAIDGAQATADQTIAIGLKSKATAQEAIAVGDDAQATGTQSLALMKGSRGTGDYSIAIGNSATASATNGMALGNNTKVTTENGTAIGNGASVDYANAIALGQGSTVGSGDGNVLSIGSSTFNRKIIHVADGTDNKDAANYGQLLKTATYTLQSSNSYSVTLQTNNGGNGPTITLDTSALKSSAGTTPTGADAANTDLSNITPEGKQNINKAFNITNGGDNSQVTITPTANADTGVTTYAVDVKTNDKVAENGIGLVTSGTVYAALEGKANTALDNITKDGKSAVKDLAIAAVAVESGNGIKVTPDENASTNHKQTYTVALDYDYFTTASGVGGGTVTSGDTKLISGSTMYSELRPTDDNGHYVKSTNLTSVNLLALDTAIGGNNDYGATADSDLNVISKTNDGKATSVKANLGALDKALGKISKLTTANTSVKDIDGKVIGSEGSDGVEGSKYSADLTGAVLAVNDKVGNLSTTKKHTVSDGTEINYYLLDNTKSLAENMETVDQYLGDVNSLAGDDAGNGAMLDVSGNKVTTAQLAQTGLTGVMLTMNAKIGDLPSKTGTGSYAYGGAIQYGASVNENLVNLDKAIGTTTNGKFVSSTASVGQNLNSLDTNKANQDLDNLTAKGTNNLKDLARKAVTVTEGSGIKVKTTKTDTDDAHSTDYEISLDYNAIAGTSGAGGGAVEAENKKLVSGETMYSELRPTDGSYVYKTNTTAENLTALDGAIVALDKNMGKVSALTDTTNGVKGIDGNVIGEEGSKYTADLTGAVQAVNDKVGNLSTTKKHKISDETEIDYYLLDDAKSLAANMETVDQYLGNVKSLAGAGNDAIKDKNGKTITADELAKSGLTGVMLTMNAKIGDLPSQTGAGSYAYGGAIKYGASVNENLVNIDKAIGTDADYGSTLHNISTGDNVSLKKNIGVLDAAIGGNNDYGSTLNHISATNTDGSDTSVKANLGKLDEAIGTTTTGTYVVNGKSVGENLNALDSHLSTLSKTVDTLNTDKANRDMNNLTDTGKDNVKDLAREAVTVAKGEGITVETTTGTDGHSTNYKISIDYATLNYDTIAGASGVGGGDVKAGDAKLVSGDTMYKELRPTDGSYVRNGNTTAANLKALDDAIGGNDDYGADADLNNITKTNKDGTNTSVKANLGALDKAMGQVSKLTDANTGVKGIDGNVIGGEGGKYSADLTGAVQAVNDKVGNLSTDNTHKDTDGTKINEYHLLDSVKSLAANMETVDQYLGDVKSLAGDGEDAIKDKDGKAITTEALANGGLASVMKTMDAKIGDLPSTENYAYKGAIKSGVSVNDNLVSIDKAIGTDEDYGSELHNISTGDNVSLKKNIGALDAAIGTTADGAFVSSANSVGQNLNVLDRGLSDLGDRVNKVGAGAAALSALHVQDFDPDNKLNFAVGFGHYKNANAGAIGAFYKPNHDTTFSIASTIGNGDNMLNAGISFKIGTSSHVEKTMVVKADYEALQKKVADQDKRLAAQDERLASQDAQIEELKKQVAALIARG